MRIPAWPMLVARSTRPVCGLGAAVPRRPRSGDGWVGVLLAVARDVLGPGRPVPVAQLVAAGGIVVPAGRDRRRCRLARRRGRGRGRSRGGRLTPPGGRARR